MLKYYFKYKHDNKCIAKLLGIKRRDKSVERYLLFNCLLFNKYNKSSSVIDDMYLEQIKSKRMNKLIKKSRSYLEHYANKNISLKDMDYIICKDLCLYFSTNNETYLDELKNLDNDFLRSYSDNKINKFFTIEKKKDSENTIILYM